MSYDLSAHTLWEMRRIAEVHADVVANAIERAVAQLAPAGTFTEAGQTWTYDDNPVGPTLINPADLLASLHAGVPEAVARREDPEPPSAAPSEPDPAPSEPSTPGKAPMITDLSASTLTHLRRIAEAHAATIAGAIERAGAQPTPGSREEPSERWTAVLDAWSAERADRAHDVIPDPVRLYDAVTNYLAESTTPPSLREAGGKVETSPQQVAVRDVLASMYDGIGDWIAGNRENNEAMDRRDTHPGGHNDPEQFHADDIRTMIDDAAKSVGLGEDWRAMEGWEPPPVPIVFETAPEPVEPEPWLSPVADTATTAGFHGYVDRQGTLRWVSPGALADVPVGWRPLYVGPPVTP